MRIRRRSFDLGVPFWSLVSLLLAVVVAVTAEPQLPFGDVNVLVVTDVHSWIGSHAKNEDLYNANYGHLLSFYERLKEYCNDSGRDLWFVMNGDWIDGTGLAVNGDPSHLIPLLEKMPWDVINTGNHELYRAEVIEYISRPGGFLNWWGHRHLASNVVVSESQQPLSNRYIVLEGKNANVLVFGFLYNMLNPSAVVSVSMVEDVVRQGWFRQALSTEQYDAIMVMAHMGHEDASVDVLLNAIRNQVGDFMPVQFITGHTHLRQYGAKDALSASMEAGRYLDTVGFVSFPRQDTVELVLTTGGGRATTNATNLFQHVFLDANVEVLRDTLGVAELETPAGTDLAAFIQATAKKLGLTEKIGCAPRNYYMNRTIDSEDSLWKLYKEQLVPTQFLPLEPSKRAILVEQGSWRYDLLGGDHLQVGDIFAVDPFNETIYYHGLVPGDVVLALNATLNQNQPIAPPYLPAVILAGDDIGIGGDEWIKLYTHKFKAEEIHTELKKLYPAASELEMTNMSSTTLWMSFVRDQWSCDGQGAFTTPWYRETADRATDNVRRLDPTGLAILISCITLMFLILMILASWCLKRVLYGDVNTQEELNAINLDRDDLVLS